GRKTARHILDIRIQASILMYDQDPWKFSARFRGAGQITAYAAIALWRRNRRILALNPAVIFGNLFRPRIIGTEAFPYRRRCQAADCIFFRALQEVAAIYIAMHVTVKQVQQFLWEITGVLSFHLRCLLNKRKA